MQIPSCTISVAACPVVRHITFRATYSLPGAVSRDTITLGTIRRAPFKLVWNLQSIPNQLLTGASLIADIMFLNGEQDQVRQEGVFLYHRPVRRTSLDVSRISRLGMEESRNAMTLSGTDTSRGGSVRVYWDKQNLVFAVTVTDTTYHAGLPERVLRATSCELLIDATQNTGLPYPNDSIIAIHIPLLGEAQQKRYQARFTTDGGFSLGTRYEAYSQHHSVMTADGKGWKVVCVLPPALLGPSIPQSIRSNVVVRIQDVSSAQTQLLSWTGTSLMEMYAPLCWGALILRGRPLRQRPLALYAIGLAAGFLLMLAGYPVCARFSTNDAMVLSFETPEGERKIVDMMLSFIDGRIPDSGLCLETLTEEFAIEAHRIDRLLKKYAHKPFYAYLSGKRMDIAKERLRSTNASEASIAEQCGFKSTEEMERVFLKFGATTPYKFRLQQQVT